MASASYENCVAIFIKNHKEFDLDEENLKRYFSDNILTGGGEIDKLVYRKGDYFFYIYFKTTEVAKRVLENKKIEIGGIKFTAQPYKHKNNGLTRYVYMDGSNVGFHHGRHKDFSPKGIIIAINELKELSKKLNIKFETRVILPLFRKGLKELSDADDLIDYVPSKADDDFFVLDFAKKSNGFIMSNDDFKNKNNSNQYDPELYAYAIQKYTFSGDMISITEQPAGKDGPTLREMFMNLKLNGASKPPEIIDNNSKLKQIYDVLFCQNNSDFTSISRSDNKNSHVSPIETASNENKNRRTRSSSKTNQKMATPPRSSLLTSNSDAPDWRLAMLQPPVQNRRRDSSSVKLNDEATISLKIPSNVIPLIIGKEGKTIKRIQKETNCKIVIPNEGVKTNEAICKITSTGEDAIEKAVLEIKKLIDFSKSNPLKN